MGVKRVYIDCSVRVEMQADDTYDPPVVTIPFDYHRVIEVGTGRGQADEAYVDQRVYTASTAVDHDLITYTDKVGDTSCSIIKGKVLVFQALNTIAGQQWQLFGDAASIGVTADPSDKIKLGPDGFVLIVDPIDGFANVATTADIVQVTPPAAAVEGKLLVVGTSA